MRQMLSSNFKSLIIEKWPAEVKFHQRNLYKLMNELEELNWVDEQVYQLCFETIKGKKRIQNLTFFDYFLNLMRKHNEDPKSPFFKKLDSDI